MDILFYNNLNSLYESYEMRITTALMANKATSRDRAIDPTILPKDYKDNIDRTIVKRLVRAINGRVYLLTKGCILANIGMKELVANDMWPTKE